MEKSAQTPTLLEVVAGYDHLRVEDYQRTYSWQKDQIDEFLVDLNECTINGEAHFLGTLILQESENKTATVVDGQQRLTTVYILVSALRDRLRGFSTATIKATSSNERDINVIDKALDFLCYSKKLDDYRFDSSRFLKTLMRNCVLAEPDKQKPIPTRDNSGKKVTLDFRKAIGIIRNWVDNDLLAYADEIDKLHRIDALLTGLLDKFIVLKVTTGTLSESLDIFLTLNNRGLPLGPSDLVRGEIMSVLSTGLSEDEQLKLHRNILEDWTAVVEQVSDPETFLRHYLVSTSEEKIQKKKVVKEVSLRIASKDFETKKKNAENFWKELQEAAVVYGAIISPRMGGECQYQLELLEGLGKSHRVVLLPILSAGMDESTRDRLVRQVFVLAFRNVIAGLNAQKLEDFYQEVGFKFRNDKNSESLLESLINRCTSFEIDPLKYLTVEGDSGFVGRALLHLVNRVTTYGATLAPVSSGESHVEHIAPQTEIEHWAETLFGKDSEARKRYDEEIGQVGNLTLLDKGLNLQAQRKPFKEKQDHYKNSNFGITRDLCEIPEWRLEVIKLRTKWLAEMFEIYWAIEREKGQGRITPFTEWLP